MPCGPGPASALPPELLSRVTARLEAWCDGRARTRVHDQVVLQALVRESAVVLFEKRERWIGAGCDRQQDGAAYPVAAVSRKLPSALGQAGDHGRALDTRTE